jgi:O-antigen ligase
VLVSLAAALALHAGAQPGHSAGRGAAWWAVCAALVAMVLWRCPSRTAQALALLLPLVAALCVLPTGRARAGLCAVALMVAAASWSWWGSAERSLPGVGAGTQARNAAGQLQASDDNRRALYAATWQMVRERPLAGHGLGSWQAQWQRLNTRDDMRSFNTAHSAPLQLWAEGGLAGLALLVAAGGAWLRCAWRAGLAGRGGPLLLVLLAWALESLVNATLRDAVFTTPMVVLMSLALAWSTPHQPTPAGTRPPPR